MTATTFPYDPLLDLAPWMGQRQASFKFLLFDAVTKEIIRELHPYRDSVPTLTHDTSRVIVRQVSNLFFDKVDTAALSTVSNRVKIQMIFPGREPYDLGVYMFLSQLRTKSTAGVESTGTLVDSMFIVDQQLQQTYSAGVFAPDGSLVSFRQVDAAINDVLTDLPVTYTVEPTPFYTIGVWTAGANRGSTINDLSIDGDYFAPWFDNTDTMRFIRAFDPSTRVPQFDYDTNHVIDRNSLVFADDLLNAPNRFIVISNGNVSGSMTVPIVGSYDIPASAPHSIQNRGFVIPEVVDWQVDTVEQANAIAFNLGQRQTVFERVQFDTIPDPRHDSYDVFRLDGSNWLEIAWSLPLLEGSSMSHVGRKVYG
jgi:hypothetical protein